jgi:molecular chaperone DnaK (HSP70)
VPLRAFLRLDRWQSKTGELERIVAEARAKAAEHEARAAAILPETAEAYLGEKVTDAVITVPAYF